MNKITYVTLVYKALVITITSGVQTEIVFDSTDILEGTHVGVDKQQSNSLVRPEWR